MADGPCISYVSTTPGDFNFFTAEHAKEVAQKAQKRILEEAQAKRRAEANERLKPIFDQITIAMNEGKLSMEFKNQIYDVEKEIIETEWHFKVREEETTDTYKQFIEWD